MGRTILPFFFDNKPLPDLRTWKENRKNNRYRSRMFSELESIPEKVVRPNLKGCFNR
ncbi:hypothetical protein [Archaeoglobus veneficus]|uniref:Uncharacterized protein n=1 Tax=Archaeoglobus veneficus (strain DSM 11195 / SNP6) TaxID=693661 RepID=F2KT82_ARCVS|nr:hypothetical protein [Archaeoglobus veneficus]AEA47112.1 hypothetical protein Arcve_1102 [Archaeoglobus veneficus SNP6]